MHCIFLIVTRIDQIRVLAIASSIFFSFVGASCVTQRAAQDGRASETVYSSTRMADGKQWMTQNLRLDLPGSYCYGDVEPNCRQYGRLYTWESAHLGCQALGDGWRLPIDDDWRQMASHYGGVFDDSPDDRGQEAYESLSIGGSSGFDALLSGGRAADGRYDDLDAHGFYWTGSESDSVTALFYNFGRGSLGFYRQPEGDKQMALAVRCVSE